MTITPIFAKTVTRVKAWLINCTISLLALGSIQAQPLATAFSYHGQLMVGGTPANGSYDVQFRLLGSPVGSSPVFGSPMVLNVPVSDGVFGATLDFGNVFDGGDRWLEIAIRPGGSSDPFTTQTPRQLLAASPYAIYAATAGNLAGGNYPARVTFSDPGNSFAGNGAGLTGLNASALTTGVIPEDRIPAAVARTDEVWRIGGNSSLPKDTFIGTLEDKPMEIRVNNQPVLRLQTSSSHAPSLIGGSDANFVAPGVEGATIAGGGIPSSPVGPNSITGSFGTVGGGYGNRAAGAATVSGGANNSASAGATVGGGSGNVSLGDYGTVSGGQGNSSARYAAVGGGFNNHSVGQRATVPGGGYNLAEGSDSFAAGNSARASHDGCFVWSDTSDPDNPDYRYTSTAPNQFAIRAVGGVHLSSATSQFFGATTRQMLNLWSTDFGIGVQADTLYQRSNWRFSWYRGGTHAEAQNDPGGGAVMMTLEPGGLTVNGTLVSTSDRNRKERFKPVKAREILEKVASLPITEWQYKDDPATRHVGPMAQDFYAAFQVGPDDRHITMVDADGVALAAIQALNEKVEELSALQKQVRLLESKASLVDSLLQRLEALEATNHRKP